MKSVISSYVTFLMSLENLEFPTFLSVRSDPELGP